MNARLASPTPDSGLCAIAAALANPVFVIDLTGVREAFVPLREAGVSDLAAHLRLQPAVATTLLHRLRVVNANPAAMVFVGYPSLNAWRAAGSPLLRPPFPEMLPALLAAAWEGRHRLESEHAYVDEHGQRRACVLQCVVIVDEGKPDWTRVVLSATDLPAGGTVLASLLEERDLQAEIFERANLLVWRSRVRCVNGEFYWKFQLPATAMAGRLFHLVASAERGDLWNPERAPDLEAMTARSSEALRTGAPGYQQEYRVVVDGVTTWLAEDVTIHPLDENEWSLVGVVSDVTARHGAEEMHRRDAAHLRNILGRADCMLWQARVTEVDGTFLWDFDVATSGLQQRIFGGRGAFNYTTLTGGAGQTLFGEHLIPEIREKDERGVVALHSGAPGYQNEFRLITPTQTFWLQEQVTINRSTPGVFDLVGVTFDVTERRAAEEERRRSAAQIRQILERVDCMLWQARVTEQHGELHWSFDLPASGLQRRLFGGPPPAKIAGITGHDDRTLYGGNRVLEQEEIDARSTLALRRGDAGYSHEFRIQAPDQLFWMHEQVSIVRIAADVWDLVGVITDVTARRTAEAALAAEKERLAVTLRAMSEGVVTTDMHGRVQFLNRAAALLTGCPPESAVGRSITEVCVFCDARTTAPYQLPLARVLTEGTMLDLPPHTLLRQADGQSRLVGGRCAPVRDTAGAITGTVLVLADVTERQRLDEHLQRASKLESVGILAGGIAHDFNNILTAIMGNLSLALLDTAEDSPAHQNLADAQSATLRARDLTQQLLTFAKGGDPIRTAVPLAQIITEVTRFVLHGSAVGCEFDLPADLWSADADKSQFAQIVQNLVINATQAMSGGGLLRISAANAALTIDSRPPVPPGDYVHLTVADTGVGINAENLARIFDPYFTTKQQGHGLGLATVYSIVRRHGGHIEVKSEIGRGSAFHIWLPAVRHAISAAVVPATFENAPLRGRVLFMDDEAPIRKLGAALLSRLGLDVEVAGDGDETIRRFQAARAEGRPFDVIVMDLTVPGAMGGRETLEELHKIDPRVRAIVSSGYSSDPVLANYRAYGFCGMVAKPYEVEHFARVLREALASKPPGGQ